MVWKAVRSIGRRNYYRGRRFSIPSINHYNIPIQEENVTEGYYRSKNGLQDATQREENQAWGPPSLLAGAAAERIRQFLHEARLLRRLLPRLLRSRAAGGRSAVL
jgi:hypothetical protein